MWIANGQRFDKLSVPDFGRFKFFAVRLYPIINRQRALQQLPLAKDRLDQPVKTEVDKILMKFDRQEIDRPVIILFGRSLPLKANPAQMLQSRFGHMSARPLGGSGFQATPDVP
jgi:hypothetical protein